MYVFLRKINDLFRATCRKQNKKNRCERGLGPTLYILLMQVQKLDAPKTLDIDLSIWIRKHVSISLHTISAP